MNVRPTVITTLMLLATALASAQGSREKIDLLLIDGTTAVFSAEGFGPSRQAAVENSKIAVLRRLLYDGIKDFNLGSPIVTSGQGTNLWLNEFFTGKYPAYKNFVEGVELIGDFDETVSNEIHCLTNVCIRYEQLMKQARSQGVSGERQLQPAEEPAPQQEKKPKPKRSFL